MESPIEHRVLDLMSEMGEVSKEVLKMSDYGKYKEKGVEELEERKLPILLNLKYDVITNAEQFLGDVNKIRSIFFNFQKTLYVTEKEYAYN